MVETRSGKSTSPYTQDQQEKMAALVRENKERKELLKQAKLQAIAEEQAAKMKKLEEEMEEKKKAAEVEAAAEAEEERKRREVKGESSGTANEEAAMEKKISEWIANLPLGEDEEAEMYVPQDERDALARELSGFRDFARDMVTHVEVRRLRENVEKFCEGAIESAKAVAAIESEAKPRKEPVKLKFPDAYGGKKEENFDNWEASVNSLANYYRKFVRNVSTIAAPLRRLLKKEAIWQWGKDCTSALKKLKRALIEYPVLKVADPSLPFVVTTDASQYGIGAVLQQDDGNGYRPVEIMSTRMPSEKVATSTYERELYALRHALEHWKHYLLGRHFKVYSNHETLRWLKTQAKITPKLTRWAVEIDQYDFELKPVKGKYNVVADALRDYRGPKIPAPNKFRGDDPKTDVGDWAAGTKAYLRGFVCAEQTKVATVLGLLEGPALKWATSTSSSLQQSMEDWAFGLGVDKLLQALEDRFADKERARKAADRIARLGQQRYSGTLQALFAEFEQLTSTPGLVMSTDDLLTNFCREAPEKFVVALYSAGHKDWRSFGRAALDIEAKLRIYFRLEAEGKAERVLHSLTLLVEDNLPFDILLGMDWGEAANADIKMRDHKCWLRSSQRGKKRIRLFHESGKESSLAHCRMSAPAFARHVRKYNLYDQVFVAYVRPVKEGEVTEEPKSPKIEKLLKEFADVAEAPSGVVERPIKHRIDIIPGSSIPKGAIYRNVT
ncbi:hypothetical protein CBR_g11972 [Chara braunii]|uniref:Reverse transcriptase/retrotransposon-derived protein RNase H-like domain-containing protein n=1 Tax=Chara braunii TaxID=69332 RepID=A0A388KQQ7_CHABU|nr:hypothetical protein CBR_g11972 [Chara braunii]|eukprot:GBG72394.1 hypothetical protein CBR_g11972 [Chara braunii]